MHVFLLKFLKSCYSTANGIAKSHHININRISVCLDYKLVQTRWPVQVYVSKYCGKITCTLDELSLKIKYELAKGDLEPFNVLVHLCMAPFSLFSRRIWNMRSQKRINIPTTDVKLISRRHVRDITLAGTVIFSLFRCAVRLFWFHVLSLSAMYAPIYFYILFGQMPLFEHCLCFDCKQNKLAPICDNNLIISWINDKIEKFVRDKKLNKKFCYWWKPI